MTGLIFDAHNRGFPTPIQSAVCRLHRVLARAHVGDGFSLDEILIWLRKREVEFIEEINASLVDAASLEIDEYYDEREKLAIDQLKYVALLLNSIEPKSSQAIYISSGVR